MNLKCPNCGYIPVFEEQWSCPKCNFCIIDEDLPKPVFNIMEKAIEKQCIEMEKYRIRTPRGSAK